MVTKKLPINYAPPGWRSDVPSIKQVPTYLGGFRLSMIFFPANGLHLFIPFSLGIRRGGIE